MKWIRISSPDPVVNYVAGVLTSRLAAGERVLWLVSGGSVINVGAAVARQLVAAEAPLGSLTVSLTDERPGPVGHADSNWQQLQAAGFELPGARLQPVLSDAGSAADTAAFGAFLDEQLAAAQFKFGLFGIGPDGHTAGLPARESAAHDEPTAYYEAGGFKRISMTPAAIARLSEAAVYAVGENKHLALERFTQDLPYAEQSAQALKSVPDLTIFNDYKGEAA